MSSSMEVTQVGQGYNTFTGSAQPSLLQFTKTASDTGCEANVYSCQSLAEVYSALDINADVAASTSWMGASFSDRFAFANSIKISSTTIVILVVAKKTVASWSINSPTFTQSPSSSLALFKTGGDCYVSEIAQGGAYYASYSFQASDKQEFSQLSNTVTAHLSGLSSTFDASFSTTITNISTSSTVKYSFTQSGMGFSKTNFPSSDQIVQFVLGFNSVDLDPNAATLKFTTNLYSTVSGCPDGWDQVEAYRKSYSDPSPGQLGIADMEIAAVANQKVIKDVMAFYSVYGCLSADTTMQSAYNQLGIDLVSITNWRDAVTQNPTVAGIASPVCPGLALGVPVASYALLSNSGGGDGGDSFDDFTLNDIELGIRPLSFTIFGNKCVDKISTTYEYPTAGLPPFTQTHGGDGGSQLVTVDLSQANEITEVQILTDSDAVVKQIWITTPHGGLIKAPTQEGSQLVSLYDQDNSSSSPTALLGWSGHSAKYLDRLTARYIQFYPAQWSTS